MTRKNSTYPKPVPPEQRLEAYWRLLNNVLDPELGVGIVDLGLVYNVFFEKSGTAVIRMTLTSMGCPAGAQIMGGVEQEMRKFDGVKRVRTELVWEPLWGPDKIEKDVRALLF